MQEPPRKKEQQTPADIAREAFRRLAVRRIAPTPEAYREIYQEIAGDADQPSAEKVLFALTETLDKGPDQFAGFALRMQQAQELRDWQNYGDALEQFLSKALSPPPSRENKPQPTQTTPGTGTKGIETAEPEISAKSGGIALVDPEPAAAARVSIPLVDGPLQEPARTAPAGAPSTSPSASTALASSMPALADTQQLRMLRDLLIRTLTLAVTSLLQDAPELAQEAEALAQAIGRARSEPELIDCGARLKQLCFRIEIRSGDMAEERELLLRLFQLLLENVGELLEDDSWLSGQISTVQELLSGPLNHHVLHDATRSLKEVIYKQGVLKHSLKEAKATVKNMMLTFIDRLGAMATSTGDYHEKINRYSQKISQAKDIVELNVILDDVMQDTRVAQTEALRARDEMIASRKEVQEAEARVQELETKLQEMSELVREDALTGSLNRRGLDDVYEREAARAERRNSPLCVALIDLDDFKRLNDTHGHAAGDEALIHLVRVMKDTLRSMDVIARFGGEEFLIVLPDTPLAEAEQTMTRVLRELTKQIFLYRHERLLITFSAGVALRAPGEDQASLIQRADAALYQAKKAGKNRVVAAE